VLSHRVSFLIFGVFYFGQYVVCSVRGQYLAEHVRWHGDRIAHAVPVGPLRPQLLRSCDQVFKHFNRVKKRLLAAPQFSV
jgi:hypothetical protein